MSSQQPIGRHDGDTARTTPDRQITSPSRFREELGQPIEVGNAGGNAMHSQLDSAEDGDAVSPSSTVFPMDAGDEVPMGTNEDRQADSGSVVLEDSNAKSNKAIGEGQQRRGRQERGREGEREEEILSPTDTLGDDNHRIGITGKVERRNTDREPNTTGGIGPTGPDAIPGKPEGTVVAPFPPITRLQTSASGRPYSSFSTGTKWFLVIMAGISAVFSPISSNIFVPAIPTLSTAFNKSEADISLGVTVYLVFQAITPSFFGSMSDSFGRRPIYVLVLTIYLGANIGLALCPTSAFWLLLVLRMLQATGGSAVIAIGAGTVADVTEPRERGKYMAIFQSAAMIGPAFGPLLGGIFAQTLGWRAIFWFLVIATAVVLVPLIFLMPETLRSVVGDGSIPPPPLSMSPSMLWHRRQMKKELARTGGEKEHVERPPQKKFQPLSAFMILFHAEIILTFIFTSLLYLEFYCILTVYSTALKNSYGLSELQIGLCYLPAGIGSIFASLFSGRYQDYLYRREMERVGGDYRKCPQTFRLEVARLPCIYPFMTCFLIGATALGWCLQVKAPLAATLVVNFFVGLGTGTNGTATIYGQDIFPGKGGAVSASLNLVRCLFGAVGTAVIQYLYQSRLGAGWTFVLLSGICVVALPLIFFVSKHARGWREERAAKKERKRVAKGAR